MQIWLEKFPTCHLPSSHRNPPPSSLFLSLSSPAPSPQIIYDIFTANLNWRKWSKERLGLRGSRWATHIHNHLTSCTLGKLLFKSKRSLSLSLMHTRSLLAPTYTQQLALFLPKSHGNFMFQLLHQFSTVLFFFFFICAYLCYIMPHVFV